MRKTAVCIGIVVLAILLSVPKSATAITFYGDRASWEAAVGSFLEADLSPYFGIETSSVALPYGETLTLDHALFGRKVPDGGWFTWSGGKEPYVLADIESTGVTGTFVPGLLDGFGLEIEPNVFSTFEVRVTLSTGDAFIQQVDGFGGAKFFGWIEPLVVSMAILVPEGAQGYAFGEVVASKAVPEPGTLLLLGSGLVALAGFGRKFRK